jgi:Na+-translocating ferredoxin:NAD+ oxidoreductase RnfD subunit
LTGKPPVKTPKELVVEPAPHITGTMAKTRLMTYTFIALLIITLVTTIMWWPVSTPTPEQITTLGLTNAWVLPLGAIVLINALIAVGVAVGIDGLLYKVTADSELNTGSAAVFGLIVTLSYSLGIPATTLMNPTDVIMPVDALSAPTAFLYVAIISLIGIVFFKKIQGMAGRKIVNPAATAKFLVLLPFISSVLLVKDHFGSFEQGGLSVPLLAGPLGWGTLPIGNNGGASFASYLQGCFANPTLNVTPASVESLMMLEKFHGWAGGASSLAVIIVGIGLFLLARKYIKWKITATYFVSIILMALLVTGIYGGDVWIRILFEVFIGSSIFLGFFMATDPATTPLTAAGQIIFGVGLGVLTVLIQTYMNFFGGSLLALIIMNLTVPLLDRVGVHKSFGR